MCDEEGDSVDSDSDLGLDVVHNAQTMPTLRSSRYTCRTYGFDLQNEVCKTLRCTPIGFHTMVVET